MDYISIQPVTPRHTGKDFLSNAYKLDWGGRVNIVGTGPGVLEAMARVPLEGFTIALNGAVEIVNADAWVIIDSEVATLPYAAKYLKGGERAAQTQIINVTEAEKYEHCDYTIRTDARTFRPVPFSIIRGDATVCGAAINICRILFEHRGRPSQVRLYGIPMRGGYYTGEQSGYQRDARNLDANAEWPHVRVLNEMIKDCMVRGMEFSHIGPTALNLFEL